MLSGVVEGSVVGALLVASSAHEVCGEEFAVLSDSRGCVALGKAHAAGAMPVRSSLFVVGYRRLIHFRRCRN